jgi:hypothetical protein
MMQKMIVWHSNALLHHERFFGSKITDFDQISAQVIMKCRMHLDINIVLYYIAYPKITRNRFKRNILIKSKQYR